MEKIAIIVPSRGRPQSMRTLIKSWEKTTTGKSEVIMGLDLNDPELKNYPTSQKDLGWQVGEQEELNSKNNRLALTAVRNEYEIIGCLSDDFIFHTIGWEDKVIECQKSLKGICYGDDLLQGRNLCTAPFIHSSIIKALGYAAPPELIHYYIDNYWLELGMRLGKLQYIPDMAIEHKHWSAGKSEKDAIYSESEKVMGKDRQTWDKYRITKLAEDVKLIQSFQTN